MVETLTDAQLDQLTELYIAYFNRAPENAGLSFHTAEIVSDLNAGVSFEDALLERADQFFEAAIAAPEFSGYSEADTADEFVTTMYSNVLGRPGPGGDAPTAAEISFWSTQIEDGSLSRGDLVLRFLEDTKALAANPAAPEQAVAQQVVDLLNNRVAVAREFAKPENSAGLTGEAAFNAGVSALALVTADPASIPLAIATFSGGVTTIDLTTGTDAGLDFVGTTGDDVFNANIEQTPFLPLQTLNSTDDINGGLGYDTLNVQLRDAFTSPAGINGIEEVNINGEPGLLLPFIVPNTLDVINADSIETIGFNNIQSDQAVINISTPVGTVNISNDFGNFLELDHIGTALDGTDDVLTVNLSNVDGATLDTDGGYETVTVNSVGPLPNSLFLDTVNPTTINVTGDQDLRLRGDALDADTLDLIDGSAFTGDLNARSFGTGDVTMEGGTGDDTLIGVNDGSATLNGNDGNDSLIFGVATDGTGTGGEGDDSFLFNGAGGAGPSFNTDDSVDGGAGTNTLTIEADTGAVLLAGVGAGIVNINRIIHDNVGGGSTTGDISLDMSESGSATEAEFAGNYAGDDITVTEISNDDSIIYSGSNVVDVNLRQDVNGVLDEINFEITGGARINDDLDVNPDVEGLNLSSTGGVANRIDEVDNVDTEVMITGDTDLIFGEGGSADAYEFDGGLIDASAFTGNLTTTLGDGNQSLIGGSGDDLIELDEGGTTYGAGGADQVDLSVGGADIVEFHDRNTDAIGEPLDSVVDYHQVFGFDVSDDVLSFDASDFGLTQTDGDAVVVGEDALFLEIQSGEDFFTTDEPGNNFNVLKFTTPAFGADADSLYEFAIGSGSIETGAAGAEHLGLVYDATNAQMVVFTVDNGGGVVSPADDIDVVAVVGMSQTDYDAFSASNITFV